MTLFRTNDTSVKSTVKKGFILSYCHRPRSTQPGTRRRDHITPVLRDLHWLPVRRRVDYKLALLVYKSLHGLAPPYLADDCILASSDKFHRRLRSADVDTCVVPTTRIRFGDRSFSAADPRIWNSLPPDLRRRDIELGEFRRLLKTLFSVCLGTAETAGLVTL